jgi:hypothetical protein
MQGIYNQDYWEDETGEELMCVKCGEVFDKRRADFYKDGVYCSENCMPYVFQVRECDEDDEQEFSIIENEDGEWRFTLEEAEEFFEAMKEERWGAKLRLVKTYWDDEKYCDEYDEIEVVKKNY